MAQQQADYTTVKEHPILFKGEMVQAILDGRKTQTRRVIKLADGRLPDESDIPAHYGNEILTYIMDFSKTYPFWKQLDCPYGKPGDRLWVRETWGYSCGVYGNPPECNASCIMYKADDNNATNPDDGRWRPSIHLPRWASRIDLEITDVRVEQVQDITPRDAFAEGVRDNYLHQAPDWMDRQAFQELWDKINKPRGYGWDVNPWVWVVEFKVAS